jgi:hypothetical protein
MGNSARTNIRTYRDSFQGIGCRTGCMLHLVFLGMLGLAVLIWAIKNRAWELSVTVELPAAEKAKPEAEERAP